MISASQDDKLVLVCKRLKPFSSHFAWSWIQGILRNRHQPHWSCDHCRIHWSPRDSSWMFDRIQNFSWIFIWNHSHPKTPSCEHTSENPQLLLVLNAAWSDLDWAIQASTSHFCSKGWTAEFSWESGIPPTTFRRSTTGTCSPTWGDTAWVPPQLVQQTDCPWNLEKYIIPTFPETTPVTPVPGPSPATYAVPERCNTQLAKRTRRRGRGREGRKKRKRRRRRWHVKNLRNHRGSLGSHRRSPAARHRAEPRGAHHAPRHYVNAVARHVLLFCFGSIDAQVAANAMNCHFPNVPNPNFFFCDFSSSSYFWMGLLSNLWGRRSRPAVLGPNRTRPWGGPKLGAVWIWAPWALAETTLTKSCIMVPNCDIWDCSAPLVGHWKPDSGTL